MSEFHPWRITVHCSDTENGKEVAIGEIRKWHLARGFSDIGYHYVILPGGRIAAGRALDTEGAGVEGENSGNIHVCLEGRDKYDSEQWASLRSVIDALIHRFNIAPWRLYVHNYFESARKQGKACPNFEVGQLMDWYLTDSDDAIRDHLAPLLNG